ncbi:MAG: 2-amino-4-hydroxy-6-hydroxymethyldihydropteridine diphosphokinase [Mariprofundales bacterium]|nr:2-amino-4-hydroxy-6-hydroxymethyldihydropteridine diphosphokinase [Mariprofundales bacterium]
MTALALVGLGSNIDPEQHLVVAAEELRRHFSGVRFSAVYRSAAVGMAADAADFLNACALLPSALVVDDLVAWLKTLEDTHGRDRSHGSWRPRTLDLDLMWFDGAWLEEVMTYPHCYLPAAELLPLPELVPKPVLRIARIDLVL